MNKFKYIILTLSALLIWSCGSDFVPPHESVQQGGFIKFDEQRVQNVDVTNNSSAFDATVSDPNGNASSYAVIGCLITPDTTLGPVLFETINSFPAELTISVADIVSAFGTFEAGNELRIKAEVTRDDGVVFTPDNLGGDLFNPGQAQAMDFSIFGLCPFIAADMTGTYLVLANELGGFFGDNNMREVVGGPGENQFTILGGNVIDREGEDLIVEVDPVTDVASIASESIGRQAFTSPPSEFDLTGLYSGVDGLVFSCAGDVRLQIETDCCGARPFQMIKQ